MNKQEALVKLATVRMAINHVLRQRMMKQAANLDMAITRRPGSLAWLPLGNTKSQVPSWLQDREKMEEIIKSAPPSVPPSPQPPRMAPIPEGVIPKKKSQIPAWMTSEKMKEWANSAPPSVPPSPQPPRRASIPEGGVPKKNFGIPTWMTPEKMKEWANSAPSIVPPYK